MSSKAESEKQKLIQDKCQIILGNLLREEDNKYCVDCDAKGPRWASWNLGIFLCIRCAGIHRNLGVHISKVKSVNLDTWTPEQVACLQQMGNSQARAVYEANLPESFRRPQVDSALEAFIRAKYEQKKYIAKEWVPPPAPKPAFDIEEEKRKEKEKKKKNKNAATIEIPTFPQAPSALPRTHSAGAISPSPKPVQQETPKVTSQAPESTDLLNLGDTSQPGGDDIFDVFLSAPMSTASNSTKTVLKDELVKSNVSSEEADFFNQKSDGSSNQPNKMTKESILSLYGSSATQVPVTQHVAPVYGIPSAIQGMYVAPQAYTQMAMGGYATAVNPAFNGVTHQMANLQISGQSWTLSNNPNTVNPSGLVIAPNQTTSGLVIAPSQTASGLGIGPNQTTGVIWPTPTCQNQNISNNLWQ